jgi:hypothetical protein
MEAQPIGTTRKAGRLRNRVLWLWPVAGLFAIALTVRPGVREGFGQTPPQLQATVSQNVANAAETPAPAPQTKQDIHASAIDERKKQIADESASLLSLANSLKAEVDKSTKDTLSVTVVRKAGEIEQLAHKMRTK